MAGSCTPKRMPLTVGKGPGSVGPTGMFGMDKVRPGAPLKDAVEYSKTNTRWRHKSKPDPRLADLEKIFGKGAAYLMGG